MGIKFLYNFLIAALLIPAFGVSAQEVDILWQGETYTPPFYEGRTLWSHQSRITFVAIPHNLGNPAALNYRWKTNGSVLGNMSGVGRSTLSFVESVISRPRTIEVEVVASDRTILASNSVYVVTRSPILAVYENNPLYGFMFNKEVGEYEMGNKEVVLSAFPFFFSTMSRLDTIIGYEWVSNTGDKNTANSVTYRTPDEGSGSSQVTVRARSAENLLQSASKNLLIKFNSRNISNLGL